MKNDIVEAPKGAQLLFQTRYVEMFGVLASEAARRGILVMIACHRINKGAWPGKGLWYDEALNFPEKRVMESWSKIAGQLCEHWNVFAADLQNEGLADSIGENSAYSNSSNSESTHGTASRASSSTAPPHPAESSGSSTSSSDSSSSSS